jgi:hypothetical protein
VNLKSISVPPGTALNAEVDPKPPETAPNERELSKLLPARAEMIGAGAVAVVADQAAVARAPRPG